MWFQPSILTKKLMFAFTFGTYAKSLLILRSFWEHARIHLPNGSCRIRLQILPRRIIFNVGAHPCWIRVTQSNPEMSNASSSSVVLSNPWLQNTSKIRYSLFCYTVLPKAPSQLGIKPFIHKVWVQSMFPWTCWARTREVMHSEQCPTADFSSQRWPSLCTCARVWIGHVYNTNRGRCRPALPMLQAWKG